MHSTAAACVPVYCLLHAIELFIQLISSEAAVPQAARYHRRRSWAETAFEQSESAICAAAIFQKQGDNSVVLLTRHRNRFNALLSNRGRLVSGADGAPMGYTDTRTSCAREVHKRNLWSTDAPRACTAANFREYLRVDNSTAVP